MIPSPKILWHIAALGLGTVVSIAIIFIMQYLNYSLFPVPENTNLANPEGYAEFISNNSIFLIGKLLSDATGSFTGGAVAIMLRNDLKPVNTSFIGLILMLLSFINIIQVTHPDWFIIATFFVYIPACWLGANFIRNQLQINSKS